MHAAFALCSQKIYAGGETVSAHSTNPRQSRLTTSVGQAVQAYLEAQVDPNWGVSEEAKWRGRRREIVNKNKYKIIEGVGEGKKKLFQLPLREMATYDMANVTILLQSANL